MFPPVIQTTMVVVVLSLPTVVRADPAADALKLLGLMGSWEIDCNSPAKGTGITYKTQPDGSAAYVDSVGIHRVLSVKNTDDGILVETSFTNPTEETRVIPVSKIDESAIRVFLKTGVEPPALHKCAE